MASFNFLDIIFFSRDVFLFPIMNCTTLQLPNSPVILFRSMLLFLNFQKDIFVLFLNIFSYIVLFLSLLKKYIVWFALALYIDVLSCMDLDHFLLLTQV